MNYLRVLFLFLVLMCFSHWVEAQTGRDSSDYSENKFTSLIFGTDYSTNTSTFGKFNTLNSQPSFSPYLSFYHKSGILLDGLVNIIGNSDSAALHSTYQINLKGGYQFKIGKSLSVTSAFTHYFYDKDALTISTLYSNYGEVNIDYQYKNVFASLSAGYLWGRISELSVNTQIGITHSWDNIFLKEDAITLSGSISGFFNNPNYLAKVFVFLNEYAIENPTATRDTLIRDLFRLYPGKVVRNIRMKLREDPLLRWMARDYIPNNVTLLEFLKTNNQFTLTSLTCNLSFVYNIGSFTFNTDYSLYKTINQPVYAANNYYHYITIGLGYSFDW